MTSQLRRHLRTSSVAAFISLLCIAVTARLQASESDGRLDIYWTDGPTTSQVESVFAPFVGKSFDGMDDSTNFLKTAIVVDGIAHGTGLGYISGCRDNSPEAIATVVERLAANYTGRYADSMENAALAILRGCSEVVAADHHDLDRVSILRAV